MRNTETFTHNGTQIAFSDTGRSEDDEPVLVCLHAFPLDARMYENQTALGARLVCLDARGFGASAPPPKTLGVDMVADDAAALMDHLSIETAVVSGTSMGGYQAMAFARRHRARLAGLVLINTRAGSDTDEQRAGRMQMITRVEADGIDVLAQAMLPMLLGDESHRSRPGLVDQVREWIASQNPAATAAALRGLARRPDASAGLRDVAVPTAVLHGEQDRIGDVSIAREIADLVPDSTLHIVPGAGHLPPLEAPEFTNDSIAALLARL